MHAHPLNGPRPDIDALSLMLAHGILRAIAAVVRAGTTFDAHALAAFKDDVGRRAGQLEGDCSAVR